MYYYSRGDAKGYLGQYGEAILDFDKTIKLNPNDGESYYHKGCAKYDLKKYEEALKDFDKAIELNQDNSNY